MALSKKFKAGLQGFHAQSARNMENPKISFSSSPLYLNFSTNKNTIPYTVFDQVVWLCQK